MDAEGFKVPHSIPQDLLLIQQLIGGPLPPLGKQQAVKVEEQKKNVVDENEDISSSSEESDDDDDEEAASEEEIAAELISCAVTDEDDLVQPQQKDGSAPSVSTSDSDSDSSSSSSEDEEEPKEGAQRASEKAAVDLEADDEEDGLPSTTSGTYFQTKNEVKEADVTVPEIDEVGQDEVLEKVGEVMNIVDNVAIVRGLPSAVINRASERALDSDTLLVFEDRKVMGYIYETFGPTSQPLYQVRFSSVYPLNPERVQEGREVYHVPARSRFVFVSQIKAIKGSDASNMHDEEPAEDELEFSDDEQEAAWKSRLKRKRGESRARSVASSRHATPNPTFMRDQELADEGFFSRNAYDEHGPYDIDYASPGASTSSRPAPMPYDDPYGEEYTAPDLVDREAKAAAASTSASVSGSGPGSVASTEPKQGYDSPAGGSRGYERPEARGRGGRDRDRDRDRRGRDRGGHRDRGRGRGRGGGGGGGGGGGRGPQQRYGDAHSQDRNRRSLSPTSLAIARATGQPYPGMDSQNQNQNQNRSYRPQQHQHNDATNYSPAVGWGYGGQPMPAFQQQNYGYAMQQQQQAAYHGGHGGYNMQIQGAAPFVQPHINPRFMSAFGMGIPGMGGGVPGMGMQGMGAPGVPGMQGMQTQMQMSFGQQQQQQYTPGPGPGTPSASGGAGDWASTGAGASMQERSSSTAPGESSSNNVAQ